MHACICGLQLSSGSRAHIVPSGRNARVPRATTNSMVGRCKRWRRQRSRYTQRDADACMCAASIRRHLCKRFSRSAAMHARGINLVRWHVWNWEISRAPVMCSNLFRCERIRTYERIVTTPLMPHRGSPCRSIHITLAATATESIQLNLCLQLRRNDRVKTVNDFGSSTLSTPTSSLHVTLPFPGSLSAREMHIMPRLPEGVGAKRTDHSRSERCARTAPA